MYWERKEPIGRRAGNPTLLSYVKTVSNVRCCVLQCTYTLLARLAVDVAIECHQLGPATLQRRTDSAGRCVTLRLRPLGVRRWFFAKTEREIPSSGKSARSGNSWAASNSMK